MSSGFTVTATQKMNEHLGKDLKDKRNILVVKLKSEPAFVHEGVTSASHSVGTLNEEF